MIEIQVVRLECRLAVLAREAVTQEHVVTRERHVRLRWDVLLQGEDRRQLHADFRRPDYRVVLLDNDVRSLDDSRDRVLPRQRR